MLKCLNLNYYCFSYLGYGLHSKTFRAPGSKEKNIRAPHGKNMGLRGSKNKKIRAPGLQGSRDPPFGTLRSNRPLILAYLIDLSILLSLISK